jgi:Protein of unknown function (DUF3662)/FHA domain
MAVLRNLESKLEALVAGTFSRAFRSAVRPVEIARKLAREMDEHKVPSVSRTYAPNEYAVYLSPDDRQRFAQTERDLIDELAAHLLEHARRERYTLLSRPKIEFKTDDRLGLGEFGIQARLVHPPDDTGGAVQGDSGHTMVYSTADRIARPLEERAQTRQSRALLLMDGKRMMIGPAGATIGRSRDCDIVVQDPNVSRHHATVKPRGGSWIVEDLGSTNGVVVNGRRIDHPAVLSAGDEIELGTATLTFTLE